MVRKVIILIAVIGLIATYGCTVQAATHEVYENGSLSTTYVTYFKDILSGCSIQDNYVAFRSGQYSYSLIVGDLEYNEGHIISNGDLKEYQFYTSSTGYNSTYYYQVQQLNSFDLQVSNSILYSDLGDYPELVERGAKYEIITAVLISIFMLSCVINRIFFYRKR